MTAADPYNNLRFSGGLSRQAFDVQIEVREDGQTVVMAAPNDGSIDHEGGTEFSAGNIAGAMTVLAAWLEANR